MHRQVGYSPLTERSPGTTPRSQKTFQMTPVSYKRRVASQHNSMDASPAPQPRSSRRQPHRQIEVSSEFETELYLMMQELNPELPSLSYSPEPAQVQSLLRSAVRLIHRKIKRVDELSVTKELELEGCIQKLRWREEELTARLEELETCKRTYLEAQAEANSILHSFKERDVSSIDMPLNRTLRKAELSFSPDSSLNCITESGDADAREQLEDERRELEVKHSQLTQYQTYLESQYAEIEDKIAELNALTADFHSKSQAKTKELDERERLITEQHRELKVLEDELAAKQANLEDRSLLADEREEKYIEFKAELEEYKAELEAVQNVLFKEMSGLGQKTPAVPPEAERMLVEDVLSHSMRLDEYETWLVSKETDIADMEQAYAEERLDMEATAQMFESIHQELQKAKKEMEDDYRTLKHKKLELDDREAQLNSRDASVQLHSNYRRAEKTLSSRTNDVSERDVNPSDRETRGRGRLELDLRSQQMKLHRERSELAKAKTAVDQLRTALTTPPKQSDRVLISDSPLFEDSVAL